MSTAAVAPRLAPAVAPRLMKVTEVAKHLGVGRDWVYRRIESGEIPVVELGNTRKNQRIAEPDLAAYIAAHTYGK